MDELKKKYLNCQEHEKQAQFIKVNNIDNFGGQLLFCDDCYEEQQDSKIKEFKQLSTITKTNDEQVVEKNWPPQQDQTLLDEIIKYLKDNDPIPEIREKIQKFFENIKKILNQKIDAQAKRILLNLQNLSNKGSVYEKYIEISKIQDLRNIFANLKNQETTVQLYRQFIKQSYEDKEQIAADLQEIVKKIKQTNEILKGFDSSAADKIVSLIQKQIEEITFFPDEKKQSSEINNYNEFQLNIQIINSDLISTQSNNSPYKFPSEIKNNLPSLSTQFESISFSSEPFIDNKSQKDFSLLYDDSINKLVNQIDKNYNLDKHKSQIDNIMNNLRLKSYPQNDTFLNDFEQFLKIVYQILENTKVDIMITNNPKFQVFEQINNHTLNNITELIKKINNINNIQETGNFDRIKTLQMKYHCSKILNKYYNLDDLDILFENYPIFDLLKDKQVETNKDNKHNKDNKNKNKENKIKMVYTQGSSAYLQILEDKNNINFYKIIQNKEKKQSKQQSDIPVYQYIISDNVLDQNEYYIIRFQFIIISNFDSFVIGLTENNKCSNDGLSFLIELQKNKLEMSYNKKNKMFKIPQDQNEITIEMRLCIKDEVMSILNYPYYNQILSIYEDFKDFLKEDSKKLKLFVGFKCQSEAVLNITIQRSVQNSI